MAELVYRSKNCLLEPIVYENQMDPDVERVIGVLFAHKVDRLVQKDGKYYYVPSDEYHRHVAEVKRFKYLSA